jgi:hypothetical protein
MGPEDFPAAHSMDTYWFAVDRDGHVACFDTGEAGAVPTDSLSGHGVYEVMRQLGEMLPSGPMRFERDSRDLSTGRLPSRRHECAAGGGFETLMFLDALDPVQEEIDAGRAREVAASRGVAVIFANLTEDLARRVHEAGHCKGCFWHDEPDVEGGFPHLAAGGIYEYGHLCENWISGPYGLERTPVTPIHIDQLPPAFRDQMKRLTFAEFCFADTPYIQPVEHTECESWETAYLDVTGSKIRPIPGKEENYADAYEAYYANKEDLLDVEPPRERRAKEE